MKTAVTFIVCCLALAASMAESTAKVTITERTSYYSVSGSTGKDIYAQIVRKGPRLTGKRGTHVAATNLTFKATNVRAGVRGNKCVILSLNIHVNALYRLPKWSGKGSRNLQAAWKNFSDHVWRHEQRHRDIGMEFARRLESGAKALTGDARRGCAGFEQSIEQFMTRQRAWHTKKHASFDASWFGDGGRQFKYDRALISTK